MSSMFSRNLAPRPYEPPTPPKPAFELTEQQETIKKRITGSSFDIVAFAGSSKTTSFEFAIPELCIAEPNEQILMCSFSNAITADIKTKINALSLRNVSVSTTHSDSMNTLKNLGVKYRLSKYKGTEVAERIVEKFAHLLKAKQFATIVMAARACSMHKLTDSDPLFNTDLTNVILEYGLIPSGVDPELFFKIANACYVEDMKQAEKGRMDFDDMIIYATHFAKIKDYKKYKTIIVDEAQDSNLAHFLYFEALKADRYIMTYDPYQRIYSFNGAVKSVEKITKDLFSTEEKLKLSYSFRCPHVISKYIRERYVPDFESFPKNKQGEIIYDETPEFIRLVKGLDDCFVLARANSTLLKYFLDCLRHEIPSVLEKSNLDTVVKGIYNDCSRRNITINQRLEEKVMEVMKAPYSDFRKKIFIGAETDNHQSAELLLAYLKQPTLMAAANKVDQFFREAERGDNKINFCTIHRSKGRQRKNGILLPYKIKTDDPEETVNIPYVAVSRFTDKVCILQEPEQE